jgi:hypothetical protein
MNRDNNNDNIVVSMVNRFVDTVSKPIPGITPSLVIEYPLALIAATLLLPIPSSAVLAFSFASMPMLVDD